MKSRKQKKKMIRQLTNRRRCTQIQVEDCQDCRERVFGKKISELSNRELELLKGDTGWVDQMIELDQKIFKEEFQK